MGLAWLAFWVFPWLLVLLPLLLLAALWLVSLARVPLVDSIRHDAMSRAPINSLFSASFASLPAIRAYQQGSSLQRKFEDLLETSGRAFFSYVSFSLWLGRQVDLLSLLLSLGALLAASLGPAHSWALLALTSVPQLLNVFQYGVRLSTEALSSLASVERMYEFSQLPQEPVHSLPSDPAPRAWPLSGNIE